MSTNTSLSKLEADLKETLMIYNNAKRKLAAYDENNLEGKHQQLETDINTLIASEKKLNIAKNRYDISMKKVDA
jgi:hypothetical protein